MFLTFFPFHEFITTLAWIRPFSIKFYSILIDEN